METEFIPYEQALALNKLGFIEMCIAFYFLYQEKIEYAEEGGFWVNSNYYKERISAPLYQQAFQFLLDQLEFISITYFNDGSGNLKEIGFNKPIVNFDTRLECLVELLKLLKNKKKYESN